MVSLGEVFSIRNGMNVKQDRSSGGLPITRIETISKGIINPHRVGYAGLRREDCSGWLLREGDILFSHINSVEHIAKCAVYQGQPSELIHGMNLLRLRADQSVIDPKYALHAMRTPEFRSRVMPFVNRAVNQASISIGNLKSVQIPLPSMQEQAQIADALDQVDSLRAKRHQAIALLEDLIQSIFLDMFGDPFNNSNGFPLHTLDTLVAPGDRINYGVVQPGTHNNDGVALIRAGDLHPDGIDRSSLMKISPDIEASYSRSRIKGNEILVGCVGAIGAVTVVDTEDIGSNVARAVARVPITSDVDREFLAAYLRMNFVQQYFKRELRTVAQPTLNIKQLKEAPVVLPPENLRAEFVNRARAAAQQRQTHRAHLVSLDELFMALQQRAFSGTLWDHEAAA
ncbi:restriction endonuclease subunit S [Streptomyces albogriseolus]|uniref:restriction endonuclease subunit S n=1 Tax=Streptomyces albogriseolus TaxID=1887 RepID=UPI0035E10354